MALKLKVKNIKLVRNLLFYFTQFHRSFINAQVMIKVTVALK